MYLVGMMNLCELRLDSHSFKQQPLNRAGLSHIDNEGVKALVDSICARSLTQKGNSPPKGLSFHELQDVAIGTFWFASPCPQKSLQEAPLSSKGTLLP